MTTGQIVVMGRKTFESIGKPLPNRETIIVSRSGYSHPGARTVRGIEEIQVAEGDAREVFICGGAEIYEQTLGMCSDLYLTIVDREVDGDAYFPRFEEGFELAEEMCATAEFRILHYRRRGGL